MFSYQDDCIVFGDKEVNGNGTFLNNEIMEFKSTNTSINTYAYLDLRISIYQGRYNFKSYDKRNDFAFGVINYSYRNSNIPTNPAYSVLPTNWFICTELTIMGTISRNI